MWATSRDRNTTWRDLQLNCRAYLHEDGFCKASCGICNHYYSSVVRRTIAQCDKHYCSQIPKNKKRISLVVRSVNPVRIPSFIQSMITVKVGWKSTMFATLTIGTKKKRRSVLLLEKFTKSNLRTSFKQYWPLRLERNDFQISSRRQVQKITKDCFYQN